LKLIYCLGLAAALALCGCGGAEKKEAVSFAKTLKQKQADMQGAIDVERDFVKKARPWVEQIQTGGAGKGAQLEQNAATATELAQMTATISNHLSQVRQAVYDKPLKTEYLQDIRLGLITDITKRQRTLQELKTLFEGVAPEFLSFKKNATYKGDTYPGGISKIDAITNSYSSQLDIVSDALKSIKAKYELSDSEI
jgi:hypothetical protein